MHPYIVAGILFVPGNMPKEKVIEVVCRHLQKDLKALHKSKGRQGKIPICRFILSYFLGLCTTMSLKEIGEVYGGLDHTTILYHVKQVENIISMDDAYYKDTRAIIIAINNELQIDTRKVGDIHL